MDEESWKIFMTWVSKIFVIDERKQVELEEKILKKEEYDMGTLATIRQDIFNDGFSNGKIVGIRDGIATEKVSAIKRLIYYKFKISLKSKQLKLIDNAPLDKLEEIERKIFEITSWEEIEEILKKS